MDRKIGARHSRGARNARLTGPARTPLCRALGLAMMALSGAWAGTAAAQSSTGGAPASDVAVAVGPQLGRVEIIGTSPLPGQGIDRNLLPYNTQVIKRDQLDASQSVNLSDFMNRRMVGVQVNDIQGSPFQGDLTFRGFRASPLIGAGQGLSVYLDGVRINEPFGDVVNFDLIPEFAVDTISLVPGANPAFGLNSLGGALAYTTFDGRTAPGVRAELSGGSFGRKRLDVSYGRNDEASGWHQFIAATAFDEDGWRDHSEGDLQQVMGKIGRDDGTTSWTLSALFGRSDLVGNGLLPGYTIEDEQLTKDLYFHRREAVYTHPDQTENKLDQVSLNFQHAIDARSSVSALAYVRHTERDTLNGDEAEEAEDDDGGEPDEDTPNAAFNTTQTRQTGWGLALSYARQSGAHQWQVGATADTAQVGYKQFERPGFFTDDRGVIPGEDPRELSVDVDGETTTYGIYATDTVQVAPRTHVTATARYNRSKVTNQLTTRDDDTDVLEDKPRESFTYESVNPALGVAHRLFDAPTAPTVFANIARNTRAPTVIELGCADPEEPCRLPAGLQADPYLDQVKSTTAEIGLRWPIAPGARFSIALYRTENKDDILFRSINVSGQLGYFDNFKKTRNQGVDTELAFTLGPVDVGIGYSYLDATYEADGVLRQGERNVQIERGTRIAGLPRHTLKLAADWRIAHGWTVGADLLAVDERGVSGNEDGLLEDPEDGEEAEARKLKVPGYGLLNLRTSWKPAKTWELYASVNNVFDKRYETFGALAETLFSADGRYTGEERDALFVAPGAERNFMVGLRYRF
jgi:outer membrane receptor protein involved in Fe transport